MKRVFIFIVGILFLLVALPHQSVYAQTTTPSQTQSTWKFVGPSQFGGAVQGTDMNAQSSWFSGLQYSFYSLSCLGLGLNCTDQTPDIYKYLCTSAAAKINNVMASTFTTQPADFGLWLADTGHSLGFIPDKVYAQGQGIGFTGLEPILPIWKAFRNVAYLLMAVVMIVLGFMVMFRKKIDPKTVVTAQNAIPRVIIALVLITFSYALVGLMIDIMYILTYFFVALFSSTGLLSKPPYPVCLKYQTDAQLYSNGGLLAQYFSVTKDPLRILGINPSVSSALTSSLTFGGILSLLLGISTVGSPALIGVGILGLAEPVLSLILTIAIIFLFIRLLFFFLGAYIQILISLLIAPIQLLFEAVPGSDAFSSWFRNLSANLIVFPVGAAMFMLSNVFTHFSDNTSGSIWIPSMASPFGLLGSANSISYLIALGILFAIPKVAESVKEMFKAKPLVGGGGGGGGGIANIATMLSMFYYAQQITPKGLRDRLFPQGGGGGGEHGGGK